MLSHSTPQHFLLTWSLDSDVDRQGRNICPCCLVTMATKGVASFRGNQLHASGCPERAGALDKSIGNDSARNAQPLVPLHLSRQCQKKPQSCRTTRPCQRGLDENNQGHSQEQKRRRHKIHTTEPIAVPPNICVDGRKVISSCQSCSFVRRIQSLYFLKGSQLMVQIIMQMWLSQRKLRTGTRDLPTARHAYMLVQTETSPKHCTCVI